MQCNALHIACREGNRAVIDIIIKNCSSQTVLNALQSKNDNNETPIHEACRFGCSILMKKIRSVYNTSDEFLVALTEHFVIAAPIHIACRGGSTELINYIITELKEVPGFHNLINLKDKDKKSPLHYACELEQNEIVALLLDNEADLISEDGELLQDQDGTTPLHVAAQFGRISVAEKLLEGQDTATLLNAKARNNETPIFHATRYKKKEFVNYLLEK